MCIGVSYTALQKEQRAVFVIPKVYSFLLRKSMLLKNFVLKRMQGSVNSC